MSRQFAVVPWRLLTDPDLGAVPKFVGATLCGFTDKGGICWPSVTTLANLTKLDERTVQRALAALEKAGHIRRWVGRGRGKTTLYQVLYDTPEAALAAALERGEKVAPAPPIREKVAPAPGMGGGSAGEKDDKKTPTTTSTRAALSPLLEEALTPFIERHPRPDSVRLSVKAHLTGATFPQAPESIIADALRQLASNGERWNVLLLAKYVQRQLTAAGEVGRVGTGGTGGAAASDQLAKLSEDLRRSK